MRKIKRWLAVAVISVAGLIGAGGLAIAGSVASAPASPAGADLTCSNVFPDTPVWYYIVLGTTECPAPHQGWILYDSCVQVYVFGGWYNDSYQGVDGAACNNSEDGGHLYGYGDCQSGTLDYRTLAAASLFGNGAFIASNTKYITC